MLCENEYKFLEIIVQCRGQQNGRDTLGQGPEYFPDGVDKIDRGLGATNFAGFEWILSVHPFKPVNGGPMQAHHSLWHPRGSRGVNHIRQMPRREPDGRAL